MLSAEAVLAAALAGLATAGLVRSPAAELRRADPRPRRWFTSRPNVDWLAGSANGLPLRRRLLLGVGAAVGLLAAADAVAGVRLSLTWPLVGPIALAVVSVLGHCETGRVRRRHRELTLDTPAALELLAAALAAGLPARRATAEVVALLEGPVAEDLGSVLAAIDLGAGDAAAWRALSQHPQLGGAAVDLARSVESGTMLVEALLHHADDARRDRRAALEVSAKAVGVRSVLPLMICFLPAFLLLGIVPTLVSAIAGALP